MAAENGEGKGWVGYVLRLNSREEIEKRIARGVVTRKCSRGDKGWRETFFFSSPRKGIKDAGLSPSTLVRRMWMDGYGFDQSSRNSPSGNNVIIRDKQRSIDAKIYFGIAEFKIKEELRNGKEQILTRLTLVFIL